MIRPYSSKDKNNLTSLLKLNIPQYFDPSEADDFVEYLDKHAHNYFVFEEQGQIIGAGGFNYLEDQEIVRISWDFIHPDFHGKGIGKKLTLYRIDQIKKEARVNLIYVRTSQLAYGFYEKMGFALEKTEKDFWAKGFDLYQMKMDISEG
ncbi:MAG: acetyltransferase [Saprospiraceae bacterium]|nr:MAG: acetyltransferase [Saprospiraceae bacterium]